MVGLGGRPDIESISRDMHQTVIGGIRHVLGVYYPQMTDDQRQLCATVSYHIMLGMMPLEQLSSDVVIEQMVLAVSAYQKAFIEQLAEENP